MTQIVAVLLAATGAGLAVGAWHARAGLCLFGLALLVGALMLLVDWPEEV